MREGARIRPRWQALHKIVFALLINLTHMVMTVSAQQLAHYKYCLGVCVVRANQLPHACHVIVEDEGASEKRAHEDVAGHQPRVHQQHSRR